MHCKVTLSWIEIRNGISLVKCLQTVAGIRGLYEDHMDLEEVHVFTSQRNAKHLTVVTKMRVMSARHEYRC